MTDKTKTVVVFESHERTVVRRSHRTLSSEIGQSLTVAPERPAAKGRLREWWRAVAPKFTRKKRDKV